MKSKGVTYVLAVLVIIIWGTIVYRVFFHTEEMEIYENVNVPEFSDKPLDHESDYQLQLDYSDPFHVSASKKSNPVVTTQDKNRKTTQKANNKPHNTNSSVQNLNIEWPQMKYGGLIVSNNNRTAIININGKSCFLTEGQSIEGITITSITSESITVTYKNHSKTINK